MLLAMVAGLVGNCGAVQHCLLPSASTYSSLPGVQTSGIKEASPALALWPLCLEHFQSQPALSNIASDHGDSTSFLQGSPRVAIHESSLASSAERTWAGSTNRTRDMHHQLLASSKAITVNATGASMNTTSSTAEVGEFPGNGSSATGNVTRMAARGGTNHTANANESRSVGNMTAGNGSDIKWIVPNQVVPAAVTSLDMSDAMNKVAVIASRISLCFTIVILVLFCYCLEGHEDCILCFRYCGHLHFKTQCYILLFCLLNISIFVTLWAVKVLRPMLLMLVLLCGFGSLCCTCWSMIIMEIFRKVNKPIEEAFDVMHYMHDKIDHVLHFLGLASSSDEDERPSWWGRLIHGRSERKKPVAKPSTLRAVPVGSFPAFSHWEQAADASSSQEAGEASEPKQWHMPGVRRALSSQEAGEASEPRQWHMPGIRRQPFNKLRTPRSTTN